MVTCRDINKTWNDNLLLADVHGVLSKIARVWGLIPCQALPTSWCLWAMQGFKAELIP
mgnify:CR=1 FL=1